MAGSFLQKLQRGKLTTPVRLVVYGTSGCGKSTFASGAPSPLFLDVERRTNHLDVARVQPNSWDEVLGVLRDLYADPGEFKTLVVDTLDHLELLLHKHVCDKNGWATIEEPSFGKGYIPALLEWQRFLGACEVLQRDKGLNVIMLAHSQMLPFKNPAGDDFMMYSLKLKGGQKTSAADLIREKADLIGFARWEDFAKKANPKDALAKAKVISTGERILSFGHNPAWESKRGIPMADEIPLSWAAFTAALEKHNGPA